MVVVLPDIRQMTEKISLEVQQQLQEYQQVQQKLRVLLSQKYQFELGLKETEAALEEIAKDEKAEVYKIVGQLLIKTKMTDAKDELKERHETMDLRLKTIEKQEKELTEKLKPLEDRLKGMIPGVA